MPYGALKLASPDDVSVVENVVAETPMPYGALKHEASAAERAARLEWRKRQCPTGH